MLQRKLLVKVSFFSWVEEFWFSYKKFRNIPALSKRVSEEENLYTGNTKKVSYFSGYRVNLYNFGNVIINKEYNQKEDKIHWVF